MQCYICSNIPLDVLKRKRYHHLHICLWHGNKLATESTNILFIYTDFLAFKLHKAEASVYLHIEVVMIMFSRKAFTLLQTYMNVFEIMPDRFTTLRVMYLDVTFDQKMIWRPHTERTVAKVFRTYRRTYSQSKSGCLNTNVKLEQSSG
jgi:hypothetical protein